MKKTMMALLLVLMLCTCTVCTGSLAEDNAEVRIRIFETSDIHGSLLDTSSAKVETFQYRLAYIAKVINDARNSGEYDDVILLDGGDLYQGTPVSNLTHGGAVLAAVDAMGYDAVALGNHEFDWGVEEYCADPDATLPAYKLGEYEGDPDIPILASNLYYADTSERVGFTKDYIILEKAGKRIAVVGYVEDYNMTIMASMIAPYSIEDSMDLLANRVNEINEAEHPDATILLCHKKPTEIAESMAPNAVSLVCGGHKHDGIYGVAENTGIPYIQCDANAQGYASATLVIAADGSVHVEDPMYTSILEDKTLLYDTPENASSFDVTVLAISHAAWDAVSDDMGEILGYIDTNIEKKGFLSDRTTSGGNFVTARMLEAMKPYGAVAAFYNMKGVRASVVLEDGEAQHPLTVGDIYAINPFNNTWQVYELTGKELAQHLLNTFENTDYGDQVTGIHYDYINLGTDEEPEIQIICIFLDDGTEVDIEDDTVTYKICTCEYCATLEGSVFLGKEGLVPEAEVPIDNVTIIELVRREAEENNGHITVDTLPRDLHIYDEMQVIDAA